MKRIFWLLVFAVQMSNAQKLKKADRTLLSNIKTHIGYLADDKLEGRRTGTAGEKLAYEYISNEFAKEKLLPKGENQGYIQDFEVNEGKQVDSTTALWINDNLMANEKDYFPLVYSANGIGKSKHTMELLGCSIEELKIYLEKQFVKGMCWNNYGKKGWHIDHILPCASFDLTDPEQQKICFHYTNLQPLWAKDNYKKRDKVIIMNF
ncbi:hypothetical protein EBU24_04530 [bacterium]|nr:hypothetical protein [bacterium]